MRPGEVLEIIQELPEKAHVFNSRLNPVIRVDGDAFTTDTANTEFNVETPEEVELYPLPTLIGEVPAWLYSPENKTQANTWIVATHGKGADLTEIEPAIDVAKRFGFSAIGTSFRNHAGAPVRNDGKPTYGRDEIEEIYATINHAIDNGAENIILMGVSLGGAIMSSALLNAPSEMKEKIRGMILMAPVLNIKSTIHDRVSSGLVEEQTDETASEHKKAILGKIGRFAGRVATGYIGVRDGLRWAKLNYGKRFIKELDVPTLVMHNEGDPIIPAEDSLKLECHPFVELDIQEGDDHVDHYTIASGPYTASMEYFIMDTLGFDPPTDKS